MSRTFLGVSLVALVHDTVVGGCLLFWPGLWHELIHPSIERITFFIPQALGAVLLGRMVLTWVTLRRSTERGGAALAALWAAQVIFLVMLAFRLGGQVPFAGTTYVLWASLSAVSSFVFFRSSSSST